MYAEDQLKGINGGLPRGVSGDGVATGGVAGVAGGVACVACGVACGGSNTICCMGFFRLRCML